MSWDFNENRDKYGHILVGFLIAAWFYCVPYFTGLAHDISLLFSLSMVYLAGIVKEIHDSFGYGTSELNDLTATVFGGSCFLLPILIIEILK